ncbi:MAG: type II secretion system F family protein, partial [Candidatus Micrarchaeia archaeon]
KILPDFLSLVAININAGVEPLSALYLSLRPDFSPITEELIKLRSLSLGSKSLVEQLSYLKERIDSNSLRMAVKMIEKSTLSGARLGKLLENISLDLRESNELENELKTSTKGYIYFILFLVAVGIPLLLSMSSIFVKTVFKPSAFGGGPSFLVFVAYERQQKVEMIATDLLFLTLIIISAITSSLMLGVIIGGEIKNGVKYIPIMCIISVFSYIILSNAVLSLLSILGIM